MTRRRQPQTPREQWMDDRRKALSIGWEDVANAAGISRTTLYSIRQGSNSHPKTLRNLENVFYWGPGSFASIDDGGEPFQLDLSLQHAQPSDVERLVRGDGVDLPARLRELRALMGPAAFWREIAAMEREETPPDISIELRR